MNSLTLMGVKGGPAIGPGSNMPSSTLVRMGGKTILVDAGLGATRGLCDQGVELRAIDLIIVTHLHSDHYLELGPLFHTAWTAGLTKPIEVIGPSGLAHYWNHFVTAMDFDVRLRIEDEGRCDFQSLCNLRTILEGEIYTADDLTISAMKNDHPPIKESFALRLETKDKTLALSGDTAMMPEMIEFATGADLLLHEAMLLEGVDALIKRVDPGNERLRNHIVRSHTSAEDTGRIAKAAGVKAMALNHFVPDGDPNFTEAHWQAKVRETWDGVLHIGRDGMTIEF